MQRNDIAIIKAFPPNIEDIKKVFNIEGRKPVFAYRPAIFNPYNAYIDEPLRIHELTHFAQQGNNPKLWWQKYLNDKEFMLSQEIEAYQNQWRSFKEFEKDRNKRYKFLRRMAMELSGELYGFSIDYKKALKEIDV